MDGFELYIKIKEKDPKAKICFLTAIATFNEEFREARSEVGRIIAEECFIQKPVTTEDLIRKLIDIMNIDMITMHIWRMNNDKVTKKSISIVFITTKLCQNQLTPSEPVNQFSSYILYEDVIKERKIS